MESYKYLIKACFVVLPAMLILALCGGTMVTVSVWLGLTCYIELLETNDRLKQIQNKLKSKKEKANDAEVVG